MGRKAWRPSNVLLVLLAIHPVRLWSCNAGHVRVVASPLHHLVCRLVTVQCLLQERAGLLARFLMTAVAWREKESPTCRGAEERLLERRCFCGRANAAAYRQTHKTIQHSI